MAAGVTEERYQEDLVLAPLERADALKAEPFLAAHVDRPPFGPVRPMSAAIPPGLLLGQRSERRLVLQMKNRNGRVREIREPARVIEIEVRGHDMAHIALLKAELLYLSEGRLLLDEEGLHQADEEPSHSALGIQNV